MGKLRWMRPLGMIVILGIAARPLFAGVVFDIEVTNHGASPPWQETQRIVAMERNVATDFSTPGGSSGGVIFLGATQEMVILDHDQKSYNVLDDEALNQLAGMLGGMMAQMNEALKGVPESQRAMVEQMMRRQMPQAPPKLPASELQRTEERATRAGYPCVRYDVISGGQKVHELWVTDWKNIEGAEEVKAVFTELAAFFRRTMEAIAGSGLPVDDLGGGLQDSVFNVIHQLDGFPVVTREVGGRGVESVLRAAGRQEVDPARFAPPAGYEQRSLFPE